MLGIALEIVRNVFQIEDQRYSFQHKFGVKSDNVKSVNYVTHMASFTGPRNWGTLLEDCENAMQVFEEAILNS